MLYTPSDGLTSQSEWFRHGSVTENRNNAARFPHPDIPGNTDLTQPKPALKISRSKNLRVIRITVVDSDFEDFWQSFSVPEGPSGQAIRKVHPPTSFS